MPENITYKNKVLTRPFDVIDRATKKVIETIPAGTVMDLELKGRTVRATIAGREKGISLSTSRLHDKFSGFTKPPTLATMNRWENAPRASHKSITGKVTDPDAEDSWMRILGLI